LHDVCFSFTMISTRTLFVVNRLGVHYVQYRKCHLKHIIVSFTISDITLIKLQTEKVIKK